MPRQIECERPLQGWLALIPSLQLLIALSKVKLDVGIVAEGARGLIQELSGLRIKPPLEV
jgi:hypothetical protein